MNIQIVSDLHLEFLNLNQVEEVWVLTKLDIQIIDGVDILFSYYPNSGWSKKHGYLQFKITEKEQVVISDEDVKRLNSIGWFKDKEFTNDNWVHPV